MKKDLKKPKDMQFAVIGLGRFGNAVATTLAEKGAQVLAIDDRAEKVQSIANYVLQAVQLDATDITGLKAFDMEQFDYIIVGVGELEPSILICLNLIELGVGKKIIAKATSNMHMRVLKKLGVEKIFFPEYHEGKRLANNLVSNNILDLFELLNDYSIEEIDAKEDFVGKTLAEVGFGANYGITIIAIKRKNGQVSPAPNAHAIIERGDILIIIGLIEKINLFKKHYNIS